MNSQLGQGNPGWFKQPKVPQQAGTTPPPHQNARGHLIRKREREASGSTNTLGPGPQEQGHRAPSRDPRKLWKGDWSSTPMKKVQLEPPFQAAPQSRRGQQGLGYQPPARDSRPLSGPSAGSGNSRREETSQSSSTTRRDPSRKDSGERQVSSSMQL